MANTENTYYYMRLKDDFFDDDAIKLLEAVPDGYLYENILLKMYVKSLKDNGKLIFQGYIPYSPEMLATITRHSVGVVEKALEVLQAFGLIEILDNGSIYMLQIQNYIGKSSTEADRKREYRNTIDKEKKESNKERIENNIDIIDKEYISEKCPDICPNESVKKKNISKIIPPTLEMVNEYCTSRNNGINANEFIDFYESKGWMIGKNKMKDWQAAVRTWEKNHYSNNRKREKSDEDGFSIDDWVNNNG